MGRPFAVKRSEPLLCFSKMYHSAIRSTLLHLLWAMKSFAELSFPSQDLAQSDNQFRGIDAYARSRSYIYKLSEGRVISQLPRGEHARSSRRIKWQASKPSCRPEVGNLSRKFPQTQGDACCKSEWRRARLIPSLAKHNNSIILKLFYL